MNKNCKDKILNIMFHISDKPVLFRDLLEANAEFNDGMLVDPAKLNFRFNYGRSYAIFGTFAFVFVMFAIGITHLLFTKIDFHFSILFTILLTSAVFIGFDCFKAWGRKEITKNLIQKAWANHFLYFPYEKYSKPVEKIYNEALKNDIAKRDLEQYVLNKIVEINPEE
ncbi:hypothetical protein OFO01_04410 [Campylobacter sp. JMF_01 NE2]|uniref:hypothetical protein n=1 Tax=unclassified Campylobacter TaxID=2593542 RepID=UPI001B467553|nr:MULTISPECIES: hypothetical protein [unclassified Campylobacter]MBP3223742.1 hypothetical protein [Campylobacter sp.]MDA3042636.1 hypothetical protein [Campylobacter sp. JMF_09 ED2]MDA3044550.1 hypothetical protein [Campylobacter sp. JMF_07 ED4]MDA3046667.1 hypothetical protein [Campylobacter sp. VBCF_06 NA8]MDA3047709.1 hypothetical protein [Campylobacter sp. JMF_08 NE1]